MSQKTDKTPTRKPVDARRCNLCLHKDLSSFRDPCRTCAEIRPYTAGLTENFQPSTPEMPKMSVLPTPSCLKCIRCDLPKRQAPCSTCSMIGGTRVGATNSFVPTLPRISEMKDELTLKDRVPNYDPMLKQPSASEMSKMASAVEMSKTDVSIAQNYGPLPQPLPNFGPLPQANDALAVQVAGKHYKDFKIQPVEFITANDLDFLQGNAIKYLVRHKLKNGAEDIKKALHYCQLILQLQYPEKGDENQK